MTTIKHKTILLYLVLLGLSFISPDRDYAPYFPTKVSAPPRIDNFDISESFDIGDNRLLLFGSRTSPQKGIGLLLYDIKSKRTLFQDISEGDEDFIKPHFFKTNLPSDQIVFLCTTGAEYTYGLSVYTYQKGVVKNIGYMDIALNENPYESSTDPGPWTLIRIRDNVMDFTFSKTVSTDFQGQKQKNYKAGELMFQFKDGKLIMQTK